MAQLDYLFKKFIENKVKTDASGTVISSGNEALSTSTLVKPENVWIEGVSTKAQLRMIKMVSIHGVGATEGYAALRGVAWSSGRQNWIDATYGSQFLPIFYVAATSVTNPALVKKPTPTTDGLTISSTSANFTFDYKSGNLTFLGSVPTVPLNLRDVTTGGSPAFATTNSIWIEGYTYEGKTLADPAAIAILNGSASSINFDGGAPDTVYTVGPVFDCGGVV